MKNTFTILVTFFIMNVAFATVRTVTNDPIGGAQFNSLLAGYNASFNGDTLLVEGTNIEYAHDGPSDWDKSLVLIGIGFNPQKQSPRRTLINRFYSCCQGNFRITSGGSGSRFYGIIFTNEVGIGSGGVTNLTFEDCRFDATFKTNNFTVSSFTWRNCIFNGNNGDNIVLAQDNSPFVSNILVSNCVLDGYIEGGTNQHLTLLVDHCLFLGTSTFSQIRDAIIQNNIFMNAFPTGTTNSSYTKNICRVAGTFPPVGGGGNSGAGNLEATNPNFVTYTNAEFYSTSHDYHVQVGSPATGAATDGTEIGLHGGLTRFSESGEVLIAPIMRILNISNPTIAPNGTINVNINATKPTDH